MEDFLRNSPPLQVVGLKFRSMEEHSSYQLEFKSQIAAIWRHQAAIGNQEKPFSVAGFCEVCGSSTSFLARPYRNSNSEPAFRVNWASLRCKCGLSARERRVISLIDTDESAPIYHVGHFSALANYLVEKRQNVVTSQFKEGVNSGFIDEAGIRYEDLTDLSFPDGVFNQVVCTEILEHIPDYRMALSEISRCLKDGGTAILTFPWLGGDHYNNRIRAELLEDGSIRHYLPPSYHGDPAKAEGILCFRDFGWEILDEIKNSGFSDAFAYFVYNPVLGYMTLSEPIVIATK